VPGTISVKGERSESRVTAPQAPPLMVILIGSRLERRKDGPLTVACLAERDSGECAWVGAAGCRREAARRAPKVLRRSGRTRLRFPAGVAPAMWPRTSPRS
jgi:hypothetical protein